MPPRVTAVASASSDGLPVAVSAPRPITSASMGMTGTNPSIATAAKTMR
jgi:hypothetical protein